MNQSAFDTVNSLLLLVGLETMSNFWTVEGVQAAASMSVSLHVFVCGYCTSKHVLCNLALTVGCMLVVSVGIL
jgi:hypothetical protein